VKKSNKKFKIFLYHHNSPQSLLHSSEIILGSRGFYSVSNKINGIKIGLQLYNLLQIHGHQLTRRIANSKAPLSYLDL